MRPKWSFRLSLIIATILLASFTLPYTASLNAHNSSFKVAQEDITPQAASLQILGANNKANPVVNEGNMLMLNIVDASGKPVTGFNLQSGSPDIVQVVDPNQGMIIGKQQGFATVTVTKDGQSTSSFVVVSKVTGNKGSKVTGQTSQDASGALYLTDPNKHQILKKTDILGAATVYAGTGTKGNTDGDRMKKAQFAGPVGVAVDERPQDGIYIADTLNHEIRIVDFNNNVQTMLGTGSPGITAGLMTSDVVTFSSPTDIKLNGPQGIAVDNGGNLFVADTGNNAIYLVDFAKSQIRLLAGQPGQAGNSDGTGRAALFNSPASISLTSDGLILNVADTANGVIRQVDRNGVVRTIGVSTPGLAPMAANRVFAEADIVPQAAGDAFKFDQPTSVTQDDAGNIYVVDRAGVNLITFPKGRPAQMVSLAQPGSVSYNQPASITIQGTNAFVVDSQATTDDQVVKVCTVGAPTITSVTPNEVDPSILSTSGMQISIQGKSFAPETRVFLGDSELSRVIVNSATSISVTIAREDLPSVPGQRTLTVQTRGGLFQKPFNVKAFPLDRLPLKGITTIAGGVQYVGDGMPSNKANLFLPSSVIFDGRGNLLIADENNNRIRRIPKGTLLSGSKGMDIATLCSSQVSGGLITTIAGNGAADFSGDGGPAIIASLNRPTSLALDSNGNIYFVDSGNFRVRKIDAITGIITTIAGNGDKTYSCGKGVALCEGVDATQAGLSPIAITITKDDKLLIIDSRNGNNKDVKSLLRLIDLQKPCVDAANNSFPCISTVGGAAAVLASKADNFNFTPVDIVVTKEGKDANSKAQSVIFVVDNSLNGILKFDLNGQKLDTFLPMSSNNVGIKTLLNSPTAIVASGDGTLIVGDQRKINDPLEKGGRVVKLFTTDTGGKGISKGLGVVLVDGSESNSTCNPSANKGFFPRTIGLAGNSFILIGNSNAFTTNNINVDNGVDNIQVLKNPSDPTSFTPSLPVTAVGNNSLVVDSCLDTNGNISTDCLAINVGLNGASNIAIDKNGQLIVADIGNHLVQKVGVLPNGDIAAGSIKTLVGADRSKNPMFTDSPIMGTSLFLGLPGAVVVDSANNIYIADTAFSRIKRFNQTTGIVDTFGGTSALTATSNDGSPAINTKLGILMAMTIDSADNIYFLEKSVDKGQDNAVTRLRRIDAKTQIVSTIATSVPNVDNDPFAKVMAIATDRAGSIYLTNNSTNPIVKIDPNTKSMTTVFANNSSGDIKKIGRPTGLVIDPFNNLFVADAAAHQILRLNLNNNKIEVVAGSGSFGTDGDGDSALKAQLRIPFGLTLDKSGNLFISDIGSSTIREVKGPLVGPIVTNVTYQKPNLTITGMSFNAMTTVSVTINGADKTSLITNKADTSLVLKGSKKKLGFSKTGANTLVVTVDGIPNTFMFTLSKATSDNEIDVIDQ